MGKMYRTSSGKMLDMDKLRLRNEKVIAVGNQKVNARGDKLGPGGGILQTRNQVQDQKHKIHTSVVGNDAAEAAQAALLDSNELPKDPS